VRRPRGRKRTKEKFLEHGGPNRGDGTTVIPAGRLANIIKAIEKTLPRNPTTEETKTGGGKDSCGVRKEGES